MTDPERDPATGRRPGPGRPPLLDDALTERIAQIVGAGNYVKVAAQYCGVGYSTLQGWLARGRRAADALERGEQADPADEPYLTLLAAVTRAETVAEVSAVTHWRAAFANDWRAARDFVVRKAPDRWAATTRIAISSDEAEQRIDRAVEEALLALGLDTDPTEPGDDGPGTAGAWDDEDPEDGERPGDA